MEADFLVQYCRFTNKKKFNVTVLDKKKPKHSKVKFISSNLSNINKLKK